MTNTLNKMYSLNVEYLNRADRTLETIQLTRNGSISKCFWIYFYEGVHFRVFTSVQKATDFLNNTSQECWVDFEDEEHLYDFLMCIKL